MPFGSVVLNDGNVMPAIAFGSGSTWKNKDVAAYVEQALEAAFCHLDTAQGYNNQHSVGAAIQKRGTDHSDVFITTKWSKPETYIPDAVRNTLTELCVKHIDLYLIHVPDIVEDLKQTWALFEKVKEEGLVKSIGVSNFTLSQLKELLSVAKIKPAVNQINFDPYTYAAHRELLELCAEYDIVVEGYSSLSSLTQYKGGPVDKPVQAAAGRLGVTPAQVLLAWAKSKGVVIVTTSSNKERLHEYLAAGDITLTDEEIAAIDEAGAKSPRSPLPIIPNVPYAPRL